jgi:hypothetical protein
MGYTIDLVTGLAEHLADAGIGTWKPDGDYTADDIAIVVGPHIPQAPDSVVCLTPYVVPGNQPGLSEHVTGVQVRCRGPASDPRTAEDLADVVFDTLQGLGPTTLGGLPVAHVWLQSSAPLGPDTSHRHERSDNYYIQANRATTYATD